MKLLNQITTNPYWSDLSVAERETITALCLSAIETVDGYLEPMPEEIEYQPRDGFSPASYNHGGISVKQFSDIDSIMGSGNLPSHKDARTEIERKYEYGLECARKTFFERNAAKLMAIGIDSKDHPKFNYHDLCDMGQTSLAESLSEYERDYNSDESCSVMYEVQFMYHGLNESGRHSASVSCAVNTEGPYHRRSIPWAPNVFCEGATEVELEWTTLAQLRDRLKKALDKTSSKTF